MVKQLKTPAELAFSKNAGQQRRRFRQKLGLYSEKEQKLVDAKVLAKAVKRAMKLDARKLHNRDRYKHKKALDDVESQRSDITVVSI